MSAIFASVRVLLGKDEGLIRLARCVGGDVEVTRSVVRTAVPALIIGLAERVEEPDGETAISSILGLDDGSVIADVSSFLMLDKPALGQEMLAQTFGSAQGEVVSDIASVSEAPTSAVRRLLPMLMPIVVGLLARYRAANRLDLAGTKAFLIEERSSLVGVAIHVPDPELPSEPAPSLWSRFTHAGRQRWLALGAVCMAGAAWVVSTLV